MGVKAAAAPRSGRRRSGWTAARGRRPETGAGERSASPERSCARESTGGVGPARGFRHRWHAGEAPEAIRPSCAVQGNIRNCDRRPISPYLLPRTAHGGRSYGGDSCIGIGGGGAAAPRPGRWIRPRQRKASRGVAERTAGETDLRPALRASAPLREAVGSYRIRTRCRWRACRARRRCPRAPCAARSFPPPWRPASGSSTRRRFPPATTGRCSWSAWRRCRS